MTQKVLRNAIFILLLSVAWLLCKLGSSFWVDEWGSGYNSVIQMQRIETIIFLFLLIPILMWRFR